jgi:alkaline phosphatase D
MNNFLIIMILIAGIVSSCKSSNDENLFEGNWNSSVVRTWVGPEYWTNPLQDWQVEKGRLNCIFAGPGRTIHLLTHNLKSDSGTFETCVNIGIPDQLRGTEVEGWAGFIIGARGEFNDYRDAAVYGKGINAGITTQGQIFISKIPGKEEIIPEFSILSKQLHSDKGILLCFNATDSGNDEYKIKLTAYKPGTKKILYEVSSVESGFELSGNLALQSHFDNNQESIKGKPGFWFEKWRSAGDMLINYPDRKFGPVLFTLYTLSKKVMKLTAQMPPLTSSDAQTVTLETLSQGNIWEKIAEAPIDRRAWTATFRVENWNKDYDVPYRVTYKWSTDGKRPETWYYEGTIKKDPYDKEEIVVAAFTGNNDLGFPNNEITDHVMKHNPDLLVYTGDQIYEPRGGFGNTIEPLDKAILDYLRKWFMFGWEYSSMLKQIPSVCLPDDHDVYHGNLWGCGGKAAKRSNNVKDWQDDGGYKLAPEWVNMVQRTQTSHMPDPFDSAPALQNISVYYTDMHVGGISFAIVEDRKWKSAPKALLPESLKVINGWAESSRFVDPEILDVPADLLGERQITFLNHWVADWSNRTIMKSVISQTIFCTIATLPDSAQSDMIVSKLRVTEKGEYPDNDIPTQDMDSNGWPKKGRDEALRLIRKAFAMHIAGDQHLATTVKYGIDEWGDASFAICVPSISNYFPRRWFPDIPGKNRSRIQPRNTGDFLDGFGNKMTVIAVANPVITGLYPEKLYDRSAGYGIIKFNKKTREIEVSNWPRQTNPVAPGAKPYEGWPVRFTQDDNYSRKAVAWLPFLEFTGTDLPPVIKITDERTGELIYAVRTKEYNFRPKVFKRGTYKIEVGEPDTENWKVLNNVSSVEEKDTTKIRIDL